MEIAIVVLLGIIAIELWHGIPAVISWLKSIDRSLEILSGKKK